MSWLENERDLPAGDHMTRNADASVMQEPGPCEGCPNRRVCADRAHPQACVAFEKFDNDEPGREWRDAPRDPSPVIGRRLLIKWHGKEVAEQYLRAQEPLSADVIAYGAAARANGNNPRILARLARSMQREGYRLDQIARIMKRAQPDIAQLLALAP